MVSLYYDFISKQPFLQYLTFMYVCFFSLFCFVFLIYYLPSSYACFLFCLCVCNSMKKFKKNKIYIYIKKKNFSTRNWTNENQIDRLSLFTKVRIGRLLMTTVRVTTKQFTCERSEVSVIIKSQPLFCLKHNISFQILLKNALITISFSNFARKEF